MIKKVKISGLTSESTMTTKKGYRERFALNTPLVKPLTRRLSGLPRPTYESIGVNDSKWMHDHSDLWEAESDHLI